MAHEIGKTDGLVLAGKPAWHGLGIVVDDAPTPAEALKIAGLDWTVKQTAGVSGVIDEGSDSAVRIVTDTHVLNVRSDTFAPLGVVGAGYMPVQNRELAELAQALGGDGCEIESAGSIRDGRRVWFLLRGEPFEVNGGKDEVERYLLLANGHDGTLALTVQPTSIRVVCSNTLHMSLGERGQRSVRILHTSGVQDRVGEVRATLGMFTDASRRFEEQARALARRNMGREEVQAFWLDVYQELEGMIPTEHKTAADAAARNRSTKALAEWSQTFDREHKVAGPTAWNAMNAVTHWYDHQKPGGDEARSAMNRWWGIGATRKAGAFKKALALV